MSDGIKEGYGPYPKKKTKKRVRVKEERFLKRTYDWLKWKRADNGGVSFYRTCLDPYFQTVARSFSAYSFLNFL